MSDHHSLSDKLRDAQFKAMVDEKRSRRMAEIDELPPEFRKLISEYGRSVVEACIVCGVAKASHVRHVVETVLDEFSPTRGSYSIQGRKTYIKDMDATKE